MAQSPSGGVDGRELSLREQYTFAVSSEYEFLTNIAKLIVPSTEACRCFLVDTRKTRQRRFFLVSTGGNDPPTSGL